MKLWQLAGWLLAAAMLVLNLGTRVDTAVLKSELRSASLAASTWKHEYETSAARVVRDTIRITRWATRYDTVRADIDSILISGDSSAVPFPVFADAIHAADSTIAACRDLVTDCARLKLVADSAIHAVARERDAYKNLYIAVKPTTWDRAKPWVVGVGAFWLGTKFQR